MNDESILTSIKKMLGITDEYTVFDEDIIMHINTVLSILNQLGVGPVNGFAITDKTAKWSDFIGSDVLTTSVKTYVALRVRLLFDTPMSSAVTEVINKQIAELESRLMIAVGSY